MSASVEDIEKFYANIGEVGKGLWPMLHIIAMNAETDAEREFVMRVFKNVIANFFCQNCQGHAEKFLEKKPLEKYKTFHHPSFKRDIGLFRWTYEFHKEGYEYLTKNKSPSFQTVYDYYMRFTSSEKQGAKGCTVCQKAREAKNAKPNTVNVLRF